MNYENIYNDLCASRKYRDVRREIGFEVHHIVPRCMGGCDDDNNLVKLTYREHYIAHKLLTKIYKGSEYYGKMCAALWIMSQGTKGYKITSRDYDNNREEYFCQGLNSLRMANTVNNGIFRTTPKDLDGKRVYLLKRFSEQLFNKNGCVKYTHNIITHKKTLTDKYKIQKEGFFRLCYTLYKLGYRGLSLEYTEEIQYIKYFYTMFDRVKTESGKVEYLFSEECKYILDKRNTNICTTALLRSLNYDSFKGATIFMKNWNSTHPDKLLFNMVKNDRCIFIPVNSWDYNKCTFLFKPLSREDLVLLNNQQTIEYYEE